MTRPDTSAPLWVFYDGECGLCSRFVAWALARDRDRSLRPEPAQSARAQEILGSERLRRSLVELHAWSAEGGVVTGPVAVAAVLRRLPGWAPAAAVVSSPALRPLANRAYAWVAARRGSFKARCPLPRDRAREADEAGGRDRANAAPTRSTR